MDDFEREYPDFDWKNTPADKHPGGINCPCPKHEHIKDQIETRRRLIKSGGNYDRVIVHIKLCPDHYRLYHTMKKQPRKISLKNKIIVKLMLWLGLIKVTELNYAQSDLCFYCKYGTGYKVDQKTEMPPPPTV